MGLNLLEQLLCLNPDKRLSAQDALLHDYFFKEEPIMPLKTNVYVVVVTKLLI